MKQATGIAVFGVGRWGVHLVRNFLQHPDARLVAIADLNPEHLTAVRDRYHLSENIVLTQDWQSVLEIPEVEAVAISTPATTHYNLIKAALESGCHVFVEKPLTLDKNQCLELCQFAEQQQRQLFIDHTYLFNPAVVGGKKVMESGCLGQLRYGYAARTNLGPVRQDVDAMWDLAIHDLAIFNNWLGELPASVRATGMRWLQKDLADVVWVKLMYKSGFEATIHVCWLNPDKQRRLCVVGSQGTLVFDEMLKEEMLAVHYGQFKCEGDRFIPVDQHREIVHLEAAEPLGKVCHHFISCVRENRRSPISSGWVGSELVSVLNALTKSLNEQGQPITI